VRGPWAYKGATARRAEETGRRLSALLTDTLRLVRSGHVCPRHHCRGGKTGARRASLRLLAAAVALTPRPQVRAAARRAHRRSMAATNKCLARSNNSRTGAEATNKRPAARRNFLGTANWRDPVGGSAVPVFTRRKNSPSNESSPNQTYRRMMFQKFITVSLSRLQSPLLRPGSRSHRFSARAPGPASSTCR
jgi:hypothetical protein